MKQYKLDNGFTLLHLRNGREHKLAILDASDSRICESEWTPDNKVAEVNLPHVCYWTRNQGQVFETKTTALVAI